VKSAGHPAAFPVQTIKSPDGAAGFFNLEAYSLALYRLAGGIGHLHHAGITRTDNQHIGTVLQDIGDVRAVKPVPSLAPPIGSHHIADDFHIAVIDAAFYPNRAAGFIRINHMAASFSIFFFSSFWRKRRLLESMIELRIVNQTPVFRKKVVDCEPEN
jgi:hypothetical protein